MTSWIRYLSYARQRTYTARVRLEPLCFLLVNIGIIVKQSRQLERQAREIKRLSLDRPSSQHTEYVWLMQEE